MKRMQAARIGVHLFLAVLWIVMAAGCASQRHGPVAAASPEASTVKPAPQPASKPASQPVRRGVITRAELQAFLGQGMQYVAANVAVERYPRSRKKPFRGWRILQFFPLDPRFLNVDIRPGDVVLRVNGHTLERPDQLDVVWRSLPKAKEIVVERLRNGEPRVLRWIIED